MSVVQLIKKIGANNKFIASFNKSLALAQNYEDESSFLVLASSTLVLPSFATVFSGVEKDNLRGFVVPFPFGEGTFTKVGVFGGGELVFLPTLMSCLFFTFFGLMKLAGRRLSHGRAAIQRSFQLQPQLALPSSSLPNPWLRLQFALHYMKVVKGFMIGFKGQSNETIHTESNIPDEKKHMP